MRACNIFLLNRLFNNRATKLKGLLCNAGPLHDGMGWDSGEGKTENNAGFSRDEPKGFTPTFDFKSTIKKQSTWFSVLGFGTGSALTAFDR